MQGAPVALLVVAHEHRHGAVRPRSDRGPHPQLVVGDEGDEARVVEHLRQSAALELEPVDVVELRVVAVQPDQDCVRHVLVDMDDPGLDARKRRQVARSARFEVDVVKAPVLVSALVLEIDDAAVVRRPEVLVDAAVAIVRDHPCIVRADRLHPDVEDAVMRRDPREQPSVERDARADPLRVAEEDLAGYERDVGAVVGRPFTVAAGLETAATMRRSAMPHESTAETDTIDPGWVRAEDGTLIPDYDATIPVINEGEVVRGTVVRVDKDEVLVDIGYKSEGVIPVSELSIRRSVNPADEVQLGDEIDALVMTKEDAEGRLILSKKRARFELAWKNIEGAAESGEPVDGTVIEVVKGGLILDLGVRGFLPASLVDIRRVQNLDEFLGQKLRCKVIELNRSRNNVVLSRRAVLEDERKDMRQAILDRLSPGDIVEGTISNIVDFGAFVDLKGIDGLIHISELSWSHVNHPSEVLEIGQSVKVKVLDIDRDRQRISLGLKQTQSDPWQQVIDNYEEGDVVHGRVTKVVTFGAFVEILPGVEGLVHISELAQHHVENPREIVQQGEVVNIKIIEMDADRRRLSLSLKRVDEYDEVRPPIGGVSFEPVPPPAEEAEPEALEAEAYDEAEPEAAAEVEAEPVAEAEAEAGCRGGGRAGSRGRAGGRAELLPRWRPSPSAEAEAEPVAEPVAEAEAEPVAGAGGRAPRRPPTSSPRRSRIRRRRPTRPSSRSPRRRPKRPAAMSRPSPSRLPD